MNTSHYPSLELCKKLTEAGFPRTQYQYEKNNYKRSKKFGEVVFWDCGYSYTGDKTWLLEAVCPSVMELIDKLPIKFYEQDAELSIHMLRDNICRVGYMHIGGYIGMYFLGTVPNALSEMWLYLKNNNLLPKK